MPKTLPLVLLHLGKLRGRRSKSRDQRPFYSFRGIPYGCPPTGELRFSRPQPADSWTGTLDCSSKESPPCLQVNVLSPESKLLTGQEDCLYLNVYTPHLPGAGRSALFPVIVYFHGGAFCVGSSDSRIYGPDFFLDHGVVLVTVNYRLGPLGFLSLGIEDAPGNVGLHDQVLALKWVQQNITAFGGDNGNVTLMGESAGGMAGLLHLVSPLSRGLFHKLIVMSGSATTPFMHNDREPSVYGMAFAKHLGCRDATTPERALKFLRSLPAKTLVEKSTLFKDWDAASPMPWKPSPDSFSKTSFMPLPFVDAVRAGNYPKEIPILIGTNSEEGLIISAQFHKSRKRWDLFFKQWSTWAPQLFFTRESDLVTEADKSCVNKIRQKFFNNLDSVPDLNESNLRKMEQILSTAIFQAPLSRDVDLLVEQGSTVYQYLFSYQGSMTMVDIFRLPLMKMILNFSGRHLGTKLYQKRLGVCHGDDLFYLFPFGMSGFPTPLKTESDIQTSRNVLRLWTQMVKTGSPNGAGNGIPEWKPVSKEDRKYMKITSGLTMEDDPVLRKRCEFWNRLCEVNLFTTTTQPIKEIHSLVAEKRNLVMDPTQLFS